MPASRDPDSILRRLRAHAALLVVAAMLAPAAAAEIASERAIKAAFVSKFIGYVDFPGHPAPLPLAVGVVGADDIARELERIVGTRGVNGRAVSVRILKPDDAPAAVHVLFVGLGESERAERLLRGAADQGILTITEFDRALRQGSVINLRIIDDRVRFEVSLGAAEKAGLKLSSRLLSVAHYVDKGAR